jgi:hypothetical protein
MERMQLDRQRGAERPVVDLRQEATAHTEPKSSTEDTPTAQQPTASDPMRIAPTGIPRPPAPAASAAAVIEPPPPVSGMDEQRGRAAQLFRSRLDVLSQKADDLDAKFQTYLDECQRYRTHTYAESQDDSRGGGSSPHVGAPYGRDWFVVWTDRSRFEWPLGASCRSLWREIAEEAASVKRNLDEIEEASRVAGIIPGVTRDLRRQYRLAFE